MQLVGRALRCQARPLPLASDTGTLYFFLNWNSLVGNDSSSNEIHTWNNIKSNENTGFWNLCVCVWRIQERSDRFNDQLEGEMKFILLTDCRRFDAPVWLHRSGPSSLFGGRYSATQGFPRHAPVVRNETDDRGASERTGTSLSFPKPYPNTRLDSAVLSTFDGAGTIAVVSSTRTRCRENAPRPRHRSWRSIQEDLHESPRERQVSGRTSSSSLFSFMAPGNHAEGSSHSEVSTKGKAHSNTRWSIHFVSFFPPFLLYSRRLLGASSTSFDWVILAF